MTGTDNSTNENQLTTPHLIAAIRFSNGVPVDKLIDDIVFELKNSDVEIAGYLQREQIDDASCCSTLLLESIAEPKTARISQALGSGSTGCRLDPRALATLSNDLRSQITSRTHLVILNRFGKGESDGQGFRIAIEKAVETGVPVLTAVRDEYVEAWREFCGDYGVELMPEVDAVLAWCKSVLDPHFQFSTKHAA